MARYQGPAAFRDALEARLGQGARLNRSRQLVVFERFLARVSHVYGRSVVLKGGLALEIRIRRARTTRDIDLNLPGTAQGTLAKLQEAGMLNLNGDFMRFEITPKQSLEAAGMPYSGYRYRSECQLAGRLFGRPFHIDVAFAEPFFGEPEELQGRDWLAFAGILAPPLLLYPVEAHIAEKLHAYTLPRSNANTRVKDLPDLALLGTTRVLQHQVLTAALEQTFRQRGTHPVPASFPAPPTGPGLDWAATYAEMVKENDLPWPTLPEVLAAARSFLNPVLECHPVTSWSPERWSWR